MPVPRAPPCCAILPATSAGAITSSNKLRTLQDVGLGDQDGRVVGAQGEAVAQQAADGVALGVAERAVEMIVADWRAQQKQ